MTVVPAKAAAEGVQLCVRRGAVPAPARAKGAIVYRPTVIFVRGSRPRLPRFSSPLPLGEGRVRAYRTLIARTHTPPLAPVHQRIDS